MVMSTFVGITVAEAEGTTPVNLWASWGDFETAQTLVNETTDGHTDKIRYLKDSQGGILMDAYWYSNHSKIIGYVTDPDDSTNTCFQLNTFKSPATGTYPVLLRADNMEPGGVYKISMKVKGYGTAPSAKAVRISNVARSKSTSPAFTNICELGINENNNVTILRTNRYKADALNHTNTPGITLSNTWQTLENTFYVSTTATSAVTGYFGILSKWANMLIDDVCLVKIGEIEAVAEGEEAIEIPKADQSPVSLQYTSKLTIAGMDYTDDDIVPQLSLKQAYTGVSFDAATGTITVDNTAHIGQIILNAQIPAVTNKTVEEIVECPINLTYAQGSLNPQIRDLSVLGTVLEGETLTASFRYYDPSNKAPNATNGITVTWYGRANSEDEWHLIEGPTALDIDVDNEYTATYTFATAPEYNEAKCVINATNIDDLSSAAVDSNVIKGPVKPEIKGDVTIPEKAYIGGTLEANFEYHDGNGDPEGTHIYQWYRLDSATDVTPEPISGATSKIYSPTEADMDKFLQVTVTPVALDDNPLFTQGTPKSSAVIVGPRKPRVETLRITQNNTVDGLILTATYDFVHEPGLPKDEAETVYKWYLNDELVSTEATYTVPVYTEGDVYVIVTPVAELEPTHGVAVTSSTIHVSTMEPMNIVESWGDMETILDPTYSAMEGYTDRIIKLDGGTIFVSDTNNNHSKEQATIVGFTTDEAHSGTQSLELAQQSYFAVGFKATGLETGAVYRFSAWMKLKTSGASTSVGLRTVSNNNAKGIKLSNNVASSFIDTNSDSTAVGSKTVGNTTVTANEWTKVSGEFYIPATATPSTKTVNFGFAGSLAGGYYLDDVSLQKIGVPELVVEGDTTIEVPKQGETAVDIAYNAKMMVRDIDITTALGVEPTIALQPGTYEGISYDSETNTLTVDNTAYAREIVLDAEMPVVDEYTATAYTTPHAVTLTYTGALNPQVRNLIVSGGIASGNTLVAEYTPYDPQGKTITESICWEGKNAEDENWTVISGETALTLNIGVDFPYTMVRCVVELTVEIFNEEHVVIGTLTSGPVSSNVAVEPTAPEVRNLTLTGNEIAGNVIIGETLTAEYDWYDVNDPKGDTKGTDTYQWYRLDSEDATPVPIPGADTRSYSPGLDDVEKLLKVVITPVSTEYPNNGEQDYQIVIGPKKPVAQNVSITKSNNILTVNYDYVHSQNIREGASTFAWYLNGTLVSTADQYTVPSNTQGNVYVKVTPVAESEPTVGVAVNSATISVNTNGGGNNGGGNSGGGMSGITPSGSLGNMAGTKPSENGSIVGNDDVTVTEAPTASSGSRFSDVQNHWAKDCIEELVEAGILKGVDEDSFEPDSKVNRAEFCTMIYRALGLENAGSGQMFGDVSSDKWYYESVQAVAEKGIINGDGRNFNPENQMTRQEMAKVIWASIADKVPTPSVDVASYSDAAEVSDWAKGAINSLSFYKILEGSDGQFRPNASMTRAEAAAVISRVLRLINGGK